MFSKKKKKQYRVDTSIDGFRYVGINLTEEQYEDLCQLNMLLMGESRKNIPVFNIMVLLKTLGLLPQEILCDNRGQNTDNDANNNVDNSLERKFGKIIR